MNPALQKLKEKVQVKRDKFSGSTITDMATYNAFTLCLAYIEETDKEISI